MSHITSIRRAAAISGVTGIIALSSAGAASAREIPGNGAQEEFRCTVSCYEGGTSGGLTSIPKVGEDGIEILQLGAGVLAGVALAGAGLALASRRGHRHAAHPA
jgi:hypothetical protein